MKSIPDQRLFRSPLRRHDIGGWRKLALIILGCVCAAGAAPATAQAQGTGTIAGRVLNEATGQYLRSATVTVEGTDIRASSEAGGYYRLLDVPAGEVKISVSYAGLDPMTATVSVPAGQSVTYDFNLTSKAYDPNVIQLGEFVVANEREGQAKAIEEQRDSLNMKTVIASDAFGDVSEGNIGEFLKFMPGVSLDYVEADVRSVSIGGMDPKYGTILMDGAPVASAGSSSLDTGRVFEFEQLSIASIETIELSRTPTPDISGSALAGVINLRSKGAFDRKGRQIRLLTTLSANSLDLNSSRTPGPDGKERYKLQPNFTAEYSDVLLNGKLGVLAGYNYSWAFAEQKAITFAWAMDNDLTNNLTEVPRLNNIALRDSPKPTTRRNYNLRLDYKLTDDIWASTRIDYNTYSGRFYSRDLSFTFSPNSVTSGTNPVVNSPDLDGSGTQVAGGVVSGVPYTIDSQTTSSGSASFNQGGGSTNKNGYTSTINSGLSIRRGSFTAEFMGQYSLATNWYKDWPYGGVWSVNPGSLNGLQFRWERDGAGDPNLILTQIAGPDWRDLQNYPNGFSVTITDRASKDQKWTGKGDFHYSMRVRDIPTKLNWGVAWNESLRWIDRRLSNNVNHLGPDGIASTADDDPALYAEPLYRMSWPFTNLSGVTNLDRFKLADEYENHPEYFAAIPGSSILQQTLQTRAKVAEEIDAAYGQAIFRFGKFTVAPGFRVERTRGTFNAPSSLTDSQTRALLGLPATGTINTADPAYINARYGSFRKDGHTEYTTPLKYLHLNYNFTDNMLLRLSYNDSITRPDLNRIAGSVSITSETSLPPRASVGNPDLIPEEGHNFWLSFEYYMPKNTGMFSVSVARHNIKNLIRGTTEDIVGSFDDDPFWDGWRLTTFDNIARSHNTSVEFNWRQNLNFGPEFLRNFSAFANHTRIFYDDYELYRRPRQMANGGLDFRWRSFSASWKTNWTAAYRTGAYSATTGWAAYNDARLYHDIQLNYRLNRNITFSLTGRNVFDQNTVTFLAPRPNENRIMNRNFDSGSFWTVGFKGTF